MLVLLLLTQKAGLLISQQVLGFMPQKRIFETLKKIYYIYYRILPSQNLNQNCYDVCNDPFPPCTIFSPLGAKFSR